MRKGKGYTQRELRTFARLVERTGKFIGMNDFRRNLARFDLDAFIKKHGMAKCRKMNTAIKQQH